MNNRSSRVITYICDFGRIQPVINSCIKCLLFEINIIILKMNKSDFFMSAYFHELKFIFSENINGSSIFKE